MESLECIWNEESYLDSLCGDSGIRLGAQDVGDIAVENRRLFVNPACDLLKYVRFFSAVKDHLGEKENDFLYNRITIELYIYPEDLPIAGMYSNLNEMEGLSVYVYRPKEDVEGN